MEKTVDIVISFAENFVSAPNFSANKAVAPATGQETCSRHTIYTLPLSLKMCINITNIIGIIRFLINIPGKKYKSLNRVFKFVLAIRLPMISIERGVFKSWR